jgi:cyclic dehypoxanthinyl futalosine synthase
MSITREQALDCFRSDDLIGIGMEADALRRRLHPEGVVSYVVEQPLDCAGPPDLQTAALRHADRIGATGFRLQTQTATPGLYALEDALHALRRQSPTLSLHGLNATDVHRLAQQRQLPVDVVLGRLQGAGLRSLSGDDAFLLIDPYRASAEDSLCDRESWLAIHRAAHRLGLASTAALTFGLGEPVEARVDHLLAIRRLQEETGGFVALTPVAYSPRHPSPAHRALDEATATDYLTTLAVARLLLDNVAHIGGTATQGLKVLQMALRFGANDAGAALPEEGAAPSAPATEEELRRLIRDAGFTPVQRDGIFGTLYLV